MPTTDTLSDWDPDAARQLPPVDPGADDFEARRRILLLGAAELLITMATPVMQGHDQWDLALAQYQAIQEL